MPKFRRRKPEIVEAEQFFDGKPTRGVSGGFPLARRVIACYSEGSYKVHGPAVVTSKGDVIPIVDGDWIITEPDGEHHCVCKPDAFNATYEPADDDAEARPWRRVIGMTALAFVLVYGTIFLFVTTFYLRPTP